MSSDDVSPMIALAHKVRRGGFSTVDAKAVANHVITLAGRLEEMEAEPRADRERHLHELEQCRQWGQMTDAQRDKAIKLAGILEDSN